MIQRRSHVLIAEALADTPAVLIVGPRQCGKSTLAQEFLTDGRTAVTLDDPDAFHLARTNPKAFLKTFPAPILIDEVQRAPEIFLPLKAEIDRQRRPGAYLLTGSTNVLAVPKLADSLAGRMEVVDLAPLSHGELTGAPDWLIDSLFGDFNPPTNLQIDLGEAITRGGFPEPSLRASQARRGAWFQSYVRALLERDVRDLANIEGLSHLPRLLALVAARVGQPLNASSLAVETGIPYTSLKRYLSLLEKVFLIQNVPAWSFDGTSTIAKSPKSFLCDTGLLCHLLHADASALRQPDRALPFLRNFWANELAKQCSWHPDRPRLMHLRTTRHLEVDFVLEHPDGRVAGISIRANPAAKLADAQGLTYLAELAGDRFAGGVVLHSGSGVQPLLPRIWSVGVG